MEFHGMQVQLGFLKKWFEITFSGWNLIGLIAAVILFYLIGRKTREGYGIYWVILSFLGILTGLVAVPAIVMFSAIELMLKSPGGIEGGMIGISVGGLALLVGLLLLFVPMDIGKMASERKFEDREERKKKRDL